MENRQKKTGSAKPKPQNKTGLSKKSPEKRNMMTLDQAYLAWAGVDDVSQLKNRANSHSVKSLPALSGALNKISGRCATLPFELLKPEGDKLLPYLESPVRKVACKWFAGWLPRQEGIKALLNNAVIYGNGYLLIHRDQLGIPYELTVINPEFVQVIPRQSDDGRIVPFYRITINGQMIDYLFTEVIHIKNGLTQDGLYGFPISDQSNTPLNLALNLYAHAEKYFERNCSMNMYMTTPPDVDIGQGTTEQEFVNAVMAAIRAGRPPLMKFGSDIKSFNDNATEAQLTEARNASLIDVANILGAPVSAVNGQQVTSYSSLVADAKNLLDNTLNPLLTQLEVAFTAQLLTEAEKDADIHFEFDRTSLDTAVETETTTNVEKQLAMGLISKHEGRNRLGYQGEAPAIELTPTATDINNLVTNYVVDPVEARQMLGLKGPAPEKPEPPAIIQAPNNDPSEEPKNTEDEPKTDENRAETLKIIAEKAIEKMFERLKRSASTYNVDKTNHRDIFNKAIPNNETIINQFFDDLDEELSHVSREEYAKIIDYRCENNNLMEQILCS